MAIDVFYLYLTPTTRFVNQGPIKEPIPPAKNNQVTGQQVETAKHDKYTKIFNVL